MRKIHKLLALSLISISLLLSGCSFEIGDTTSFLSSGIVKYNDVDIFEQVEDFEIAVKPISYKQSSKKDDKQLTFTFEFENKGEDIQTLTFADFAGYDSQANKLDVEFESKNSIKLDSKETKEIEISISGKDASILEGYEFTIDNTVKKYKLEISNFDEFDYRIFDVTDAVPLPEVQEVIEEEFLSDYDMTPYRTKWGNDTFGYVTLSDDWALYESEDVDNSKMLQYGLEKDGITYLVTLSATNKTGDEIIEEIAQDDAKNDNVITLGKESAGSIEENGARINMYMSLESNEDSANICTICTTDRKESENAHYFAFEAIIDNSKSYDDVNTNEFMEIFNNVISTYSEFLILDEYYGGVFEDANILTQEEVPSEKASSDIIEDTNIEKASIKKDENSYYLKDLKDGVTGYVKVPEGFDFEIKETSYGISFVNEGYYTSIFATGYADKEDIDFIAGKPFDDKANGFDYYKSVTQKDLGKYESEQGTVYMLCYDKENPNTTVKTYKAVLATPDGNYASAFFDGFYIESDEDAIKILKQLF